MTTTAVVASAIRDNLPYSLERDLVPVVGVGSFPMALTVVESSTIKSFGDFIAASKVSRRLELRHRRRGHDGALDVAAPAQGDRRQGHARALQGQCARSSRPARWRCALHVPVHLRSAAADARRKAAVLGVTSDSRLPAFPTCRP